LIGNVIEQIPGQLAVFGARQLDLDACQVVASTDEPGQVTTEYKTEDGTRWTIDWTIEPGSGDLVLRTAATTAQPIEEFRFLIPGCDIVDHTIVWVDGYGVGHTANAPWTDRFLADPLTDGSPMRFPHPLVALFQGDDSGWFVEARDTRVGPACVMVRGQGQTAVLCFSRRFIVPTTQPEMHEIRFRAYEQRWEDAVDPDVDWMERTRDLCRWTSCPLRRLGSMN
jgi:hypothetical protein